jgi:tetratricopeptide (TPR) repeat protein
MSDVDELWDFEDPAGSEHRFRRTAEKATGADRITLLTQVARALGLQGQYAEGHALLDELHGWERQAPDEAVFSVDARIELERGRLYRSAGDPEQAADRFEEAVTLAREAGNDPLEVDAVHMQAVLATGAGAVDLDRRALELARRSSDPAARPWEAPLLNNLGLALVDVGSLDEALSTFEDAVAVRESRGERRETQIGRWMVAWTLRLLGRRHEALALQRSLKDELTADGIDDPYVDEEIALLTTDPG